MVTPTFLGMWFLFSTVIFMGFTFIPWIEKGMDTQRSVNTAIVLLSQSLGALVAGVIHALY